MSEYLQKDSIFENSMLNMLKYLLLKINGCVLSDTRFSRDSYIRENEERKYRLFCTIFGLNLEIINLDNIEGKLEVSIKKFRGENIEEFVLGQMKIKPYSCKTTISLFKLRNYYICAYPKNDINFTHPIKTIDDDFKQFYEFVFC